MNVINGAKYESELNRLNQKRTILRPGNTDLVVDDLVLAVWAKLTMLNLLPTIVISLVQHALNIRRSLVDLMPPMQASTNLFQ